jgi:hypothetical protein
MSITTAAPNDGVASVPDTVSWHAWDLHVGSVDQCVQDRVALQVIAPAIREVPNLPWFFIRYWQGGPHLRLRVGNTSPAERTRLEDVLKEGLSSAGRLLPGETPVDPAKYAVEATRLAETENGPGARPKPLCSPGVRAGSYEREVDRYGGPALMPATERMFQVSSELVLAALPRVRSEGVRAALAMHATISAAAALGGDAEATKFVERGYSNWRRMLGDDAREWALRVEESTSHARRSVLDHEHGPFLPWYRGLMELSRQVRDNSSTPPGVVLFSHVHMLHNRLGVTLAGEIQTYARLGRHLGPPC